MRKTLIICYLVLGSIVGIAAFVFGSSGYLNDFNAQYGTSGTALNTCSLCHTSVPNLNTYGNAFLSYGYDFTAIENLDSDGDGFSNIAEIQARTFPGNASSFPAASDTTRPTVTGFTIPPTATSLTVSISSFTAIDNVGVTGYLVTESATAPAAGAAGWTASPPAAYTFTTAGAKTLYAWAKDAAGNVSLSLNDQVTITVKARIVDFDGDGKNDMAVWHPADGRWSIMNSQGGLITAAQWGMGSLNDIPVPGDYDGDGKTDLAIWRPGDGTWWILNSQTGSMTVRAWGAGSLNDVPVPGDYDGDGKTDLAVWRPADGTWWILNSQTESMTVRAWGTGSFNDVPVPGDFDGDGKTDLAVWRPGDGSWWIVNSRDGSITTRAWGIGSLNDVPVPADYNGDGKIDLAVWRPGDGTWWIINSQTGEATATVWGSGAINDVPVPGDFDGDGKADLAVWRPGDGTWWIINSQNGSVTTYQLGALNDQPITANSAN